MKRPNLVKCIAIVTSGAVAVAGMIIEPAVSLLAIGLFVLLAWILCEV